MTIIERIARVSACIQAKMAEQQLALSATDTKKDEQKKQWGSFDKWNDGPVFETTENDRK